MLPDTETLAGAAPAPTLRVAVPLWTKLGALFGGVYGVVVATYGYLDWEATLSLGDAPARGRARDDGPARGRRHRPRRPRLLPRRVRPPAPGVRGHHARAASPSSAPTSSPGAPPARDESSHWQYVVDSTDSPYPVGFPIFDGTTERDLAFEGRVRYIDALADDAGTWHTVLAPIRTTDGGVVGLVEARERRRPRRPGARRSPPTHPWPSSPRPCPGGLPPVVLFGRILSRHLAKLAHAAQRVARGKLDTRVNVRSRDEIGVLATTFNQMVDGLKEREFIRDTFGRCVNPAVVSQILEDRSRLRAWAARPGS
ncbi:MAG: HAMP domain-containing protein [Myxococcota bacterium]